MDALPEFELLHPTTVDAVRKARAAHPDSRLLGGGTDLVVNIRRGIVAPPVLIDLNGVAELRPSRPTRARSRSAPPHLSELAAHLRGAHYPVVAQAAHVIAGPTHEHGHGRGNLPRYASS